jgi:hypothetical protein
MVARGEYPQTMESIKTQVAFVGAIVVGPECEEFEADYAAAVLKAKAAVSAAFKQAEQAESDRLELEALRKKQAERDEADRIAKIAQEAADKAKRDAEEAAQAEAAKVAAKVKADLEAAEKARKAAADATQAELDRVAAKAQADAEAAQQREDALIAANAKAIQDAKDTEARLAREAKAKADEEQRQKLAREADTKHRSAVNRAALAAFVEGGIDEETAKKAIALIAKKMIPSIAINY